MSSIKLENCDSIINSLKILHLNIQSLNNKTLDLEIFIKENNNADILCLSEHWLSELQVSTINISGYNMNSSYCRKNFSHGGTIIWTKEGLESMEIDEIKHLSVDRDFECCGIFLKRYSLVIVEIYRSPLGNFDLFLEKLDEMCSFLFKFKEIVICGDFNINFIDNSRRKLDFFALLDSYNIKLTTLSPTRITSTTKTCIDNILTTNNNSNYEINVIPVDFSDHDAILMSIKCINLPKQTTILIRECRIFSKRSIQTFLQGLQQSVLTSTTNTKLECVDYKLQEFYSIFNSNFNNAFPKIKKVQKLNAKSWITKGIKISSKNKRQLFTIYKIFQSSEIKNIYNIIIRR